MFLNKFATPLISIICGILVLIFPTILNYIIGLYLILIGIMGFLIRI